MRSHERRANREKRHLRVRKTVSGSSTRPRLSVFRSLNHAYVQVIDDSRGHTLAAASTLDAAVREQLKNVPKAVAAQTIGRLIAERAQDKGITQVVFDRGGYKYHGRVKAIAEAAREAGLVF